MKNIIELLEEIIKQALEIKEQCIKERDYSYKKLREELGLDSSGNSSSDQSSSQPPPSA